jgi:cellulose synthase/poly-beta-1,6-N-acetylglucosamine synthase-like glycosyltransferase
LPAFDAACTLGVALESVRRQTEIDFECVVVDDGSGDETGAIARRLSERDSRFRVVSMVHGGIVAALGRGLAACRGRYVARMDADDVMRRCRLADQVSYLALHPELAAVACHVRMFPRATLSDGLRAYERWLNSIDSDERVAREAFVECPVAHPTLMFRRSVLEHHGYRDCGWPEDYDLVLRLLGAGERIGVVPRRLLCWRDRPERLWRTHESYALARITRCKAEFLAAGPLAAVQSYVLWGYGGTGKALSRALAALGRRPSHIVELHPGRIGQKIAGAPVISPNELPGLARSPIVVSVAGAVPRAEIRAALAGMGYCEGKDFVCAA